MPTHVATSSRIETIDTLAKTYASLRAIVADRVSSLQADILALHKRRRTGILAALADARTAQEALVAAIQDAPDLFVKPRTMTLHNIRLGYTKGRGKVEWTCEDDQLVARLKKRFGDLSPEVEQCIETIEKIDADALRELDGKDLAALGVSIEGTGDVVFVKAADGEVDKLVKKILKEGAVEDAEEGAK